MQIDFLLEEESAEEALRHLLPKMIGQRARWKLVNFGSKYKLLDKLSERLAGYCQRISEGEDLRVVVLVDRDDDDCLALKHRLEEAARQALLATKTAPDEKGRFFVVNRVVVEELESWFIGDPLALRRAFGSLPAIDGKKGIFRVPDNGGSWEKLHRFLKKHGVYKSSYPKIKAAQRIAACMDIQNNNSHSFRVFREGVEAVLA